MIATCLLFLALVWQAGTKYDTRQAYDASTVSTNPVDRISLFGRSAINNVPVIFNDLDALPASHRADLEEIREALENAVAFSGIKASQYARIAGG